MSIARGPQVYREVWMQCIEERLEMNGDEHIHHNEHAVTLITDGAVV